MPDISLFHQAQELTEEEIVNARDRHPLCNDAEHAIAGLVYPPSDPGFYVKFGNRQKRFYGCGGSNTPIRF
jgi:hypothetical protein